MSSSVAPPQIQRPIGLPVPSSDRIDPDEFRAALGNFTTGVVAVTALHGIDSTPAGVVVNSFTSVSLDPALVLFCMAHTSSSWPKIRTAERYCVNILGKNQHEISTRLASRGSDKFRGLSWSTTPTGAPVLDGTPAWLECSTEAEYPAGDHDVVVARVHRIGSHGTDAPLVFYRGAYGRLAD
ncbi:flavin reductase family protein [Streptomyces misionensis]|uniref:Flavin reductase family protein n=1 Tax=Streptomyces misionensis TaxID=67331 RepID=A0A5C6J0N1_9ACTN|nr:flavin reductase family protein [Streptomyces misionensis]TWV34949.1 flavin reductase family protein [Streptomyces misionensis]